MGRGVELDAATGQLEGCFQAVLRENGEAALVIESGQIVDAHGEAAKLLGRGSQNIVGLLLADCFASADWPRIADALDRAMRSGGRQELTLDQAEPGAQAHRLRLVALPLPAGLPRRVLLLLRRDVAEAAGPGEERWFRAAAEAVPAMLVAIGPTGDVLYANQPVQEFLGEVPAHVDAPLLEKIIHLDDRSTLSAASASSSMEVRLRHRSGEFRWASIVWRQLADRDGRVAGHVAAAIDVSERRKAVQQLTRLRTAVEQAAEEVMLLDCSRRIEYANPAMETASGYSREELFGKDVVILHSDRQGPVFFEAMHQALEAGKVWRGDIISRQKAGTLSEKQVTISPVRDASGAIASYVSIARDVTELRAVETQLRAAQRAQAVGRLAGGIAHDFNNLLAVVLTSASVVERRLARHEPVAEELEVIRHTAEQGATLVHSLLAFARQQHLEPVDVELAALVADMEPMLRRLLPENIEISANASPAWVNADEGQLREVLLNLAVNARDAMPHGGKLAIETGLREVGPDFVKSRPWAAAGRFASLVVRDSGIGIDSVTLENIFEPFFTTKGDRNSGLGLPTVYGIVKQHGGFIDVTSTVGAGTVFEVLLPRLERAPQPRPVRAAPAEREGRETLLVVEDHPSLRRMVVESLVSLGYTAIDAPDAETALTLIEAKPEIALVVCDIELPGKSGLELVAALRAQGSALPFLLCSGYDDEAYRAGALPPGPVAFLPKPHSLSLLATRLRELLDWRSGARES